MKWISLIGLLLCGFVNVAPVVIFEDISTNILSCCIHREGFLDIQ